MTETENVIKVYKRNTGKTAAKLVRKSGLIPGIYYVKSGESYPFSVAPQTVKNIVHTSETKIFNIQFDGETETHECILKEAQFDPVTDNIIHLDFYGIIRGQKFTTEVPIVLKGSAKGVKEGGILQQALRNINISCLPKNLPNAIEVNISDLGLGATIHVKDLKYEDIEFLVPGDTPIVSVVAPRVAKDVSATKEEVKTSEE